MKKFISIVATFVFIFNALPIGNTVMASGNDSDAELTIISMVEAVQSENWDKFTELMCSSEKAFYENYFENDDYTDGIKQVENIEMINIYNINQSLVYEELLIEEYPILEKNNDIYCCIAEFDCKVSYENQYFYNGINYFLIVAVCEDNQYKIVQFNRPSLSILENIVEPTLDENDSNYNEEKNGIYVIEKAEEGVAINSEKVFLTTGFEVTNVKLSNVPMFYASGSSDFPTLSYYTTYTYPTNIRVKMNKTGNGEIRNVNFDYYIKNTLPNEWFGSWDAQSLKAGAYCVKMVGWYRKIKPVNNAAGYDVSQGTQNYIYNSSTSSTNAAFNSIKGWGMANSEGNIFYPQYAAGEEGDAGIKGCGQLKQWGSQYLASKKGYTYKDILNYYYEGSIFSDGKVRFFAYK